jgi:hypothetical protein
LTQQIHFYVSVLGTLIYLCRKTHAKAFIASFYNEILETTNIPAAFQKELAL